MARETPEKQSLTYVDQEDMQLWQLMKDNAKCKREGKCIIVTI